VRSVAQIKDKGMVNGGWIGVQIQPVTADIGDELRRLASCDGHHGMGELDCTPRPSLRRTNSVRSIRSRRQPTRGYRLRVSANDGSGELIADTLPAVEAQFSVPYQSQSLMIGHAAMDAATAATTVSPSINLSRLRRSMRTASTPMLSNSFWLSGLMVIRHPP
jgi:hypothetical protein